MGLLSIFSLNPSFVCNLSLTLFSTTLSSSVKSVLNASFNSSIISDNFSFSSGLYVNTPSVGDLIPESAITGICSPSSLVSILYESKSTSCNNVNGNGLFFLGNFLYKYLLKMYIFSNIKSLNGSSCDMNE